jgi:hypothetical protein
MTRLHFQIWLKVERLNGKGEVDLSIEVSI